MRAKKKPYPTAAQLVMGPVYVDGYRITRIPFGRWVQYVVRQVETGEEHREGSIKGATDYARRAARSHQYSRRSTGASPSRLRRRRIERIPWSILPPPRGGRP